MYPMTKLLLQTLQVETIQDGICELQSRLTGNNPSKKLQLAANAILSGHASAGFLPALADATGLSQRELKQAMEQTASIQYVEEWKARFASLGPHIRVTTKGPITSATFAAMTDRKLRIRPLGEPWCDLELPEMLRLAAKLIRDWSLCIQDPLPIFGQVQGFTFYSAWNQSHRFDRRGNWVKDCVTEGYYAGYVFVAGKAWPDSLMKIG